MDNAEMTSQMAQISTVNGIEKLNASLQKLTSGSTDSQVMQAAAMLGREVLVEGDRMAVVSKDGAVRGGIAGFELKAPADDVKIKVFDVNGRQVATIPLGSAGIGIHDFQWSGQTDAGAAVADGTYRFKVEASRGSEKLSATLLQAGMVSGITRSSTGVGLQLANLAGDLDPVSVDAVRQIY
jgi:flagellar basal-body rod modification protein FlgD